MSVIGFVDKMYARNRLCYLTISSGQYSDYEQNKCQLSVILLGHF